MNELARCPACDSDKVAVSVFSIEVRCDGCGIEIRFYVPEGSSTQTEAAIIRKYNALPRRPRYETMLPSAEGIYIVKDDTGNLWMPISIYKKSFPVECLIYETFGQDGYDDLSKLNQKGYQFAAIPEPGDGRE